MKILKFPVEQEDFKEHVLSGLQNSPKRLSPKFFYDKRGSELFEKICQQEEYYIPRIETQILKNSISKIIETTGPHINLVEFGSGASVKTRILLSTYPQISTYLPVDISEEFLKETARRIDTDFPKTQVIGISADFTGKFELPCEILEDRTPILLFFPGSSIGNFGPEVAKRLLQSIDRLLRPKDFLLIGFDRKKKLEVLEQAYNDKQGVTAEFNKNILHRIRDELNIPIDPQKFKHKAFYNEGESRMEMHLVSKEEQEVSIGKQAIRFKSNESIHTESSYKFEIQDFLKLLESTSLQSREIFSDVHEFFSVLLLEKKK